jgi:hypothetical protein
MKKINPALRQLFAVLGLFVMATNAAAQSLSMICENPGREYQVTYTLGSREIIVNPDTEQTRYRVLAVEEAEGKLIVAAQTPNGGPAVRVHFRPYRKMEYFVDGQVFQTDGCY